MQWLKLNKKFVLEAMIYLLIFLPFLGVRAESIEILDIEANIIDGKTAEIKWLTNKESLGKILYGKSSDKLISFIGISSPLAKYHAVKIGNLEPETTYYYQIVVEDESGVVSSFVNKFKTIKYNDGASPQISNAEIPYKGGTLAVVKWQTDEKSTSVVEYDSAGTYKSKASSGEKVTSHLIVLKKLKPNTQYFLRLYSADKDNNKSGYTYKDFITLLSDTSDKEDLKFSYLRPSGSNDPQISAQSLTVSFKTNHYAKGKVSLSGKGIKTQTLNLDYDIEHAATFTGLTPDTSYNIAISMTDVFGKKKSEKLTALTKRMIYLAKEDVKPAVNGVKVLGIDFSYYTSAIALYKAAGSQQIYSIINGQRRHIISPTSFKEYGYRWQDVKIVNQNQLLKYPPVKLAKGTESAAVYYLYHRPAKILKIKIPSPSVFRSYPDNAWGNIVKITQNDLNAYEEAKLIKVKEKAEIYYLENNIKHYVSEAVFKKRGFKASDVVEINQLHLDSLKTGAALE